jgi:hypothetical protein
VIPSFDNIKDNHFNYNYRKKRIFLIGHNVFVYGFMRKFNKFNKYEQNEKK